jgi:hypothetical protein
MEKAKSAAYSFIGKRNKRRKETPLWRRVAFQMD